MVPTYGANMQQIYRSSLSVDTQHAQTYFDNEDTDVLDENILETSAVDSGLDLSPDMLDSRRGSFATMSGPPLFSPPTKMEDWHSIDMQSMPSNNPFFDSISNNPFLRNDVTNAAALASQANAWPSPFSHTQMDGLHAEYDANVPMFRTISGQTPLSHVGSMFNFTAGNQPIPNSPQKDFVMGSAQANGKRTRPASPVIRSHNDLRRGDGIRKKNARFEIPAERNLSNIDSLISQSTDESEIKELKQQKRLLRNRQAALDSRQRKKQHTERLEDEKKHFTTVITDMEEEMADLKKRMELLMQDKAALEDYSDRLMMERDEMIRSHTNETGDLRKKITILTDHVQRLESGPTPTTTNTTFPGVYGDMGELSISAPWDNNFIDDYALDSDIKTEMPVVPAKKSEMETEKTSQQGGILFMLFLVGAFVLSSRSTPALPPVPDYVRAEAATLLDNVMKDAGVGTHTVNMIAPQPSGNWADSAANMPMNNMGADTMVAPSMLGDLGDSLTQPTQQQANEQLFSMSAQQYNGVMDQDFIQQNHAPGRFNSQGRKNLAEALASMRRTDKQNGAAEVYTRSLLWDQIPNDVVRNFAKMVAECNSAQNEQQCNEPIS